MLILYHGSNIAFDAVDLCKAKDRRDFGRGFYLTTIKQQAEDWARSMQRRLNSGSCYVYTFEFELHEDLDVKTFDSPSVEWLEMVRENRVNGGIQHKHDIVIGSVANDNTFRTIALYIEGDYTAEQAIAQLSYFKTNDQFSMHTEKALQHLVMTGREDLDS